MNSKESNQATARRNVINLTKILYTIYWEVAKRLEHNHNRSNIKAHLISNHKKQTH